MRHNMDLLSGSDSDSQGKINDGFQINKKYAKSYEKWRKKEEKQKLIDKYGKDFNSSSDSEEEEIRPSGKLDKEWLRAYAVVRFNQPRLYSGEKLFNEEVKPVTISNEKKVTLKDYERKFILEKGGVYEDDDNDEGEPQQPMSYFEEQEEIKNSLKQAIVNLDDAEEKDEDTLLVKKEKSKEEEKEEENDYLSWLKGEREDLEDEEAAEELAPLKAYWSDPNLTDKEKVLRDYILNNGYMDKEGSDDDSDDDSDIDFNKEEEFLGKADAYEQIYNFRHEEPGGIEIKTYPRNIETSVRAKEVNPRAEKRKRKLERKLKEKEQRLEEIKMLQRLQQEEKEQKLQKLKEIAENPDLEYDLEADFDLEEHNKIMKKYFDDSYYKDEASSKKPVFEADDEAFDNEDDWWQSRSQAQTEMEEELANEGEADEELYADEPGFVMDADYNPNNVEKVKKSKKEAKKMKKKQKLEKLPLFDPTTKTFDEYLDEYLKDKINTLPFTYREVVPNDFGLSTDEILTAPDRELNSWVSVKKMSMYRTEHDEMYDFNKFRAKSSNQYKKLKVLPSLQLQQSGGESSGLKKKKKKKKKNKNDEKGDGTAKDDSLQEEKVVPKEGLEKSDKVKTTGKGKKRKLVSESEQSAENHLLDDPESKKKKKKRTEDQTESTKEDKTSEMDIEDTTVIKVKKKSKKDEKLDTKDNESEGSDSQESPKSRKKKKKKQAVSQNETENQAKSEKVRKEYSKKQVKNHPKVDTNEDNDNSKDQDLESADNRETQKPRDFSPSNEDGESLTVEETHEVTKTKKKKKSHKKKKSKLKLDDSDSNEHRPAVIDKDKAKQNLRKVMSASRLGSYGIGPGANKHAGVKTGKKKKRKVISQEDR